MHLAIGTFDTAVVIVYLLGVTLLGVWLGRGQRDLTGYLLGGHRAAWWLVLLSIVATETSTVTFLSIPGLAFDPQHGNLLFLQMALGFMLGRLVVVFLLLPQYFRREMFTAYEVLQYRFGGATKRTASLMFLVTRNLADGLRLYLTALVLQYVAGLDLPICIIIVGTTTIIYTVAGGMRSVIWNDCIQFCVYITAAALALAVILSRLPDGWGQLAEFARQHGKFQVFDFSLDLTRRFTLWSGLVGGVFLSMATHGTDQLMVQRYLAARSRKEASWALGLSGLVVFAQFALFLLIGVGLARFFASYPPKTPIVSHDQAFAVFIVDHLPVGMVGITLAGVFAAAMSCLSGSLNSSAAAAVNDWYLALVRRTPSEKHLVRLSRGLTVVFGLVQIGVGLAAWQVGLDKAVIDRVLAIASFTAGATLGVFFLGVLTTRVSQPAALAGLLGGLAVVTTVAYRTPLAWPWYAAVGSLATFGIGWSLAWFLPAREPAAGAALKAVSGGCHED